MDGEKKTFPDIFLPAHYFARLFCISPYSLHKGALKLSKFLLFCTVVAATFSISTTIIYFEHFYAFVESDFAKASTIKFLRVFRIISNLLLMIVIVISSTLPSFQFQVQLQQMHDIDSMLANLKRQDDIDTINRQCYRSSIFLTLLVNVFFNILSDCLPTLFFEQVDWIMAAVMVSRIYPRLIHGSVNVTFYVLTMAIEKRFKIINEIIREKIVESNKVVKYPVEATFSDDVRYLIGVHKKMVEMTRMINSRYGLQCLMSITIDFVLIIGDLHSSIYIIFFDLLVRHTGMVVMMLKNCVIYLFELFYIAKRSTELCYEANLTKCVLLGIRIDIEKEDERNTVIASALKLMQNKLEITACKLFTIDNALLFSIVGAVSSYLFIMLQLDMGNQGNNVTTSVENVAITTPISN